MTSVLDIAVFPPHCFLVLFATPPDEGDTTAAPGGVVIAPGRRMPNDPGFSRKSLGSREKVPLSPAPSWRPECHVRIQG